MKTRVVNIHAEPYDVLIDRTTIYGNKYRLFVDGTRLNVIKKFRVDLIRRMKRSKSFTEKVYALKGKRLGCHCKPLPCHGDVYVEILEGE